MLRPYSEGDLETVLHVWYRAASVAHSFLTDEFMKTERTLIAEQWIPASETSVYELDDKVVGFLSLSANEVGGLFVDPTYQGRGVGQALMDWARSARPLLELSVFEANHKARRFYETYGFVQFDRIANGTEGQPELRLRLTKAS